MADVVVHDYSLDAIEAKNRAIQTALEMIGQQAEGYVAALTPVDTGRLRGSITHAVEDTSAIISTNVEYSVYVEMGTKRTKAQPYMKPGVYNHIDEYKRITQDCLENA